MTKQPGDPNAAEPDQPVVVDSTETTAGEAPSAPVIASATDDGQATERVEAAVDDPADGTEESGPSTGPVLAPAAAVIALLSLGWLAAMLWSTREAIHSAEAGVTVISLSAFALPGVISAALVAGAAVALTGGNLLARRYGDGITLRFVGAIGAGMLVGLLAAVAINLTYADNATTNVIAGTTAAAAIIGGAVAGARSAPVVGAISASALGALIFVVAFSRVRDPLFNLFGAGDTQESLVNAAKWVSRTESLLAGVVAGLLAFAYLSWSKRRTIRQDPAATLPRWPGYLLAGAGPGLFLLLAEVIIRVGGRSLLDLASALSEADSVAQTMLGSSRVDNGIWVLFVGALVSLIAFGRTLGSNEAEDEPADDAVAVGTTR
ncbi:hypothetical protein E1211_07740 [Micromonospora sp. 15K316]|uniref:hypothetical protein n=1 Tax=Micromonospora sp. 15K316 TaxID=2530376 RepID=UPI001048E71F|nr:hypothetical protein [Micromonospora sp. 15K316]TDC38311.1 hypothetical protein E1211_07740 [Micromonospora sp. 15K316]